MKRNRKAKILATIGPASSTSEVIENSMMTPSMKVRRFKVKDKYGEELENLY